MEFLSKIFLTAWLAIGSLFGYQPPQQQPLFGGVYNPTGGGTYRLQSSISSTQTNITLSSFKEPISNIPYTMSYLNTDVIYGTINPQNNTFKEFISATGITQNSDGTATLTGVTRGLSFSYPYTASTTLAQSHSGQSIFILSNTPQFYNRFYNLSNVSTSTNTLIFSSTTPPRYDNVGVQGSGSFISTTSELASVAYVNAVSFSGGVNATETTKGISELATQTEMASSTEIGGSSASLVLQSKYATSSPYTTGLYVPITRNDGKLSPLFIATTSSDTYNFGGQVNFNASTTLTSTTTIAANSSNRLSLNSVPYTFPSSQGSSGSALINNGSGSLSWGNASVRYTYATTSLSLSATNGHATSSANFVIPSGLINASSTINFKGNFTCDNSSNGDRECQVYLRNTSGQVLTRVVVASDQANSQQYSFDINIGSLAGSSNWSGIGSAINYTNNVSISVNGGSEVDTTSTMSLSGGVTFVVTVNSTGTLTTATLRNYSIVVNP